MTLCSRCDSELPVHARFCNCCGLSQTSASIVAINQQMPKVQESIQPSRVVRKIQPSNRSVSLNLSLPHRTLSTKPETTSTGHALAQKYIPFTLPTTSFPGQVEKQKSMAPDTVSAHVFTPTLLPHTFTAPSQQINISSQPASSSESIVATSKAAQRWRQSWQERQRLEEIPAAKVSRGQAKVSAPLKAGHNNFVDRQMEHLYADNEAEDGTGFAMHASLYYWSVVVLLVSLIIGLLLFILLSI